MALKNPQPTTPPPRRNFLRGFFGLIRQASDLRGAAGVVAVNAKIAGCFADAAFVATPTFGNWRKLRHFIRQLDPLGDMLVAFERPLYDKRKLSCEPSPYVRPPEAAMQPAPPAAHLIAKQVLFLTN